MVASCSYHSREDNRTPEEEGVMHDGIFVMVQINSYLSPGHFYGTLKNGVIFPFVTPIAVRGPEVDEGDLEDWEDDVRKDMSYEELVALVRISEMRKSDWVRKQSWQE
ncbi:hypothetical protein RHGRI_013138 [Rhododendron griersonianum]|uniref:Uncharacterized protein n=1 Tax=Rhododendron griersonianum TaxID=479676 RepID=A0AAV6K4T8_9ERIC|nr:hypothetical protein RHGRI_013138 [Rhododendron griersonianum]